MKQFNYTINGIKYRVEINSIEDNVAEVSVNGTNYSVEIEAKEQVKPVAKPKATPAKPAAAAAPATTAPAATPAGGAPIQSPLPGVIIGILCKVGDVVKKGQKLVVLEAMKMENDIKADRDGTITAISVSQGESVQEGATLVMIG